MVGPSGSAADVAVMRAFLQVLSADEVPLALSNVAQALEPGGTIYVIGRIVDDSRLAPTQAALFNVTFLNVYDGGQAYTESQHRRWLGEAGFEDFQIIYVTSGDSIVRARKRL